jgi:acyl-CoA synthetase (AMP-forming)/AMP-acid ligase II
MYGLTGKRCVPPPEQLDKRSGSVGIAIPNTEAYVVDDTGAQVKPGKEGELVIRGPHVMQGYWEDEVATAKALRPGYNPWEKVLYTGDLFRSDEEGFLYFVERKDDIIKTRGERWRRSRSDVHFSPALRSGCGRRRRSILGWRSMIVVLQSAYRAK